MKGEMKNKLFAAFAIFALCAMVLPQVGVITIKEVKAEETLQTQWTQTYGGTGDDYGMSLVETSDGGFLLVGRTESFGAGGRDAWLVRTDASGNVLWNKTYGGTDTDYVTDVIETSDGGFLMPGFTKSFGAGGYDVWLVKTDASGNMLWNMTYGGSGSDYGYEVIETTDSGYLIMGATKSFGAGSTDAWLIKTDTSGNMLWNMTLGGTDNDYGYSLLESTSGGYAFLGKTKSYGAGDYDFWLVRTDASGNMLWNTTYGWTSKDEGYDLVETSDGGFLMAGETSKNVDQDICVFKADATGNELSAHLFGGDSNDEMEYYGGPGLIATSDGEYGLVGWHTTGTTDGIVAMLIKLDVDGNQLWNQTWKESEGTSYFCAVVETIDGGYAMVGACLGDADFDVWLVKASVPAEFIDVGVMIDYGDGTYDYSVVTLNSSTGMNGFNATQVAASSVTVDWSWGSAYVTGINGHEATGSEWWSLWQWNVTGMDMWDFSSVGADSITLVDGDVIGWRLDPDWAISPTFVPVDHQSVGAPDTTMTLSTPPSNLSIGSTFTVTLSIDDAVDCTQWVIKNLTWNPSVLNISSAVTWGDFIPAPNLPFISPPDYGDGILPEASVASNSVPITRTSGDGILATFTFEVVGYGDSNIVIGMGAQVNETDENIDYVQTFSTTYYGLDAPTPSGPTAVISSPADDTFVVVGTTVDLDGNSSLPGDDGTGTPIPIDSYQWSVTGPSFSQNFNGAIPGDITLSNIGDYVFNLTVSAGGFVDSVVSTVHVLEVADGAVLDVYTNRGGALANVSSDAFGPQELVVLYANVTYNGAAVAGKDVAFEIRDADGTLVAIRTGRSDENGVATASYRIPWPEGDPEDTFGIWCVEATVDISQVVCYDKVCFEFGYVLEVVLTETLDPISGDPVTSVDREESVDIRVSVKNIRKVAVTGKVCISLYDEGTVPHQCVTFDLTVPALTTAAAAFTVTIPSYAFVGLGTVYSNILTDFPSLGGVTFCPEHSVNIDMTI